MRPGQDRGFPRHVANLANSAERMELSQALIRLGRCGALFGRPRGERLRPGVDQRRRTNPTADQAANWKLACTDTLTEGRRRSRPATLPCSASGPAFRRDVLAARQEQRDREYEHDPRAGPEFHQRLGNGRAARGRAS